MKLLSKNEVNQLKQKNWETEMREKRAIDTELKKSIDLFNTWKGEKERQLKEINHKFYERVCENNGVIDQLMDEIKQLETKRNILMRPIEPLKRKYEKLLVEVSETKEQNATIRKELTNQSQELLKREEKIDKKNEKLQEREKIDAERSKRVEESEAKQRELIKSTLKGNELLEKEIKEFKQQTCQKETELKVEAEAIKSQKKVLEALEKENKKQERKLFNERLALNTAWAELKKLKEEYDRRK